MEDTTNRMIDIHNHSLPNIDDGAKDLEEAIKNIEYLKSLGVTDVILTSHYIANSKYTKNVSYRVDKLKELQDKVKGINLYLGNEVYISDSKTIIKWLKEKEITTLNSSRYLLIEFPMHHELHHLDKIICELNEEGITPIIAHPERYSYYWKKSNHLQELLEYDCLLQGNIGSMIGEYGRNAKKMIKKLLKENKISFLATDFHHQNNKRLEKSLKKLKKLIGEEELKKLVEKNPSLVLKNEEIK